MIRFIPATHVMGGRFKPGRKVLMAVRVSASGPRKLATIPIPHWLWVRAMRRWVL